MAKNDTPPARTPYLTVDEAAALLRVSTRSIYRMVERGDLRVLRVGAAIRIPRTELEQTDGARSA